MDTSDPDIAFDKDGKCNKCTQAISFLNANFESNMSTSKNLDKIINDIKKDGKNKKYDCIIGVSGGLDSTYTLYIAKKLGLRPLAVHLDNGWNSELAQKNIESMLRKLNVDLFTFVLDWEEFKDLQRAFLLASTADSEIPTDHAIVALLYQTAIKNKVKYIITGVNYSTESIRVTAWSNGIYDWKYINSIHKKFGRVKLQTYPHFTMFQLFFYKYVYNLKRVALLDFVEYNKNKVIDILFKKTGYKYYGQKHYESLFTKFYQAYILPVKFGYDKRRVHLSSLICSRQISRSEALKELEKPLYNKSQLSLDKEYIMKKFNLTLKEFNQIMSAKPKKFTEYDSYQKKPYYHLLFNLNEYIKKTIHKGFYY
jgi:N-acetyl sugar amidotransferase